MINQLLIHVHRIFYLYLVLTIRQFLLYFILFFFYLNCKYQCTYIVTSSPVKSLIERFGYILTLFETSCRRFVAFLFIYFFSYFFYFSTGFKLRKQKLLTRYLELTHVEYFSLFISRCDRS